MTAHNASCVHHKPDSRTFALHPDYIALCPESHAQAITLQVLENETNESVVGAWLGLTYQDFVDKSLQTYAWRTFFTALADLEARGLVESRMEYNEEHSRHMKQYRLRCETVSAAIEALTSRAEVAGPRGGYLKTDASISSTKGSIEPIAKTTGETQVPEEGGQV